jgi:glucose/arabinose dehydrogenase/azurin/lysophospholipase L1-like esterase
MITRILLFYLMKLNTFLCFKAPLFVLILLFVFLLTSCAPEPKYELNEGDRIAIIGNSLADRMQHDGWLETFIQAAHPDHQIVIRNLGFTGDQVHHRPRAHEDFGDADHHLTNVQANIIFAFFGYNESYEDNPEAFKANLREWIDHTKEQQYDGESVPDIVLFSPIAHENLNDPNFPDGSENNQRLEAYARAMEEVAAEYEITFVDLFHASQELYGQAGEPLTINGVHLSDYGNRQIAEYITDELFGGLSRRAGNLVDDVREAVLEKNWHWHNRYRATSGNDVWGSRAELHGNRETLQHELVMLDVMTANRDELVWARARGEEFEVDDSNVPPPDPVETNFDGEANYLGAEEAMEKITLADGLEISLFASEEMFPELVNPVQMQMDTKGRLWVSAWATYPKWEPLKEMTDKLLILEDTTGDGVADKSTTFASIHNPTGFEFWNGGVIVVSAPDILFLKDTTGDDKADVKVRLMGAIDSADTHHTANNVVLGPDGWIYYQRGVFHLSNVETPWHANQESETSGLYRFNPRTHEFEFVVENIYNPHGISFDKWGYQFITDGTRGAAYQVYPDFEAAQFESRRLLDHTIRPVPGNQVLSSDHFPAEYQNNFLIYNVIGFRGAKRYQLEYDNGVVWGEEIGDLFVSDDPNFRPTDGAVGNDGALYISDWQNAIIGHMQHNLRDPMRDHTHGRVYRITASDRPLSEPVSIHGESIEDLLHLLTHPVDGVRHRVRIELSERDTDEVLSAVGQWVQQFDHSSENGALPLLEGLWIHQQHNRPNYQLLGRVMSSPVENARIAAQRVEWHWEERMPAEAADHAHDDPGAAEEIEEEVERDIHLDLTDAEVARLTIVALVSEMRFNVAHFTIRSGQPVELTLDNPDFMPHNLLITEPGTVDDVYRMAVDLGSAGFDLQFIPDTPMVLQATDLLQHEESQTLEFTAPDEPGTYHFICTFPGHGEMMRGIMEVVE